MRKKLKIIIVIIIFIIALLLLALSYYLYQLSPVSDDKKVIEVTIPKGSTGNSIATILKDKDLIRDTNIFKLYLKLNDINNMNYGTYELNKAMGVKKIVDIISEGESKNIDIRITFKEGLNMRGIAKVIAENTNNTENEVFALLKDEEYIDSLIDEYWFLTDEIKNDKLYYPLEGYLSPNTYNFLNKDISIKDIFKKMLDQTENILSDYKDSIASKDFTIHEFLTLASIVEMEGVNDEDRAMIASVFYNRLEQGMAFQSCPTACYATKFDGPCKPSNVNTGYKSPYNTYQADMIGLPIGPIANPGEASIKAALEPETSDYLFFLSDKDKKTYFSKTHPQHLAKKQELIKAEKWLE